MAKIKTLVFGVLVALALVLSGCDGVSYNSDSSTWNGGQATNGKGGVICVVDPTLATCK